MAREGYARATVSAIGRAAGLTPGLLHYHFGCKHDMLVALVERLRRVIAARADARLAGVPSASPRGRLHAFLDAHVALGDDADPRAVAAWVVVGAEALRDPEVREVYTTAVRATLVRLRRLLTLCLEDEGRRTHGVASMAAGLLSAIEGAYRVSAAAPGALPEGFAAPTLRRMADGMLDAQPAA